MGLIRRFASAYGRNGSGRLLIGCIILYGVGNLSAWLVPEVLYGSMQHYGVSAAQAGVATLAEGVIAGLLSMALGFAPLKMTYRSLALLGFTLYVLSNALTPWASQFDWLLGLRLLAGIADAFLIFVGVSLAATTSRNPDRSFAAMSVVGTVYGAAILAALPLLSPESHGLTYLPFAAAAAVLLSSTAALLPATIPPAPEPSPARAVPQLHHTRRSNVVFGVLLVVMVAALFQSFAMFSFSPGLGERLKMSEAAINTALGAATLASIIGPLAAGAVAQRFGRWGPMLIIGVLLSGANVWLAMTQDQGMYRVSLMANLTCGYSFMPLLLAWCAEMDPTGRRSSIMMGGINVAASLTPTVAGYFVGGSGLDALLPLVCVSGFVCIGLLVVLRFVMQRGDTRSAEAALADTVPVQALQSES